MFKGPLGPCFVELLRAKNGHIFQLFLLSAYLKRSAQHLKRLDFVALSQSAGGVGFLIVFLELFDCLKRSFDAGLDIAVVEMQSRDSHQKLRILYTLILMALHVDLGLAEVLQS